MDASGQVKSATVADLDFGGNRLPVLAPEIRKAQVMTAPIRPPRPRRAARFTQSDLARALKAALAAEQRVAEALVTRDGDIRLIFVTAEGVAASPKNDWD